MKTRADIYGQEATELLRLISLYPGLIQCQLAGFFPGKDSAVVYGLLSHLQRQGRAEQSISGGWFPYGKKHQADSGLIQSVWVLLDVIDRVEYHSPGDFPAKVIFFSGGEKFETKKYWLEKSKLYGKQAILRWLQKENIDTTPNSWQERYHL